MKNILITGISGQLGLSIFKRVSSLGFDNVLGCDLNEYSLGAISVKSFYVICSAESPSFISEILKIVESNSVTHLFVTIEREIEVISQNRDRFKGINLIMNSSPILNIFLDKYSTSKLLSKNGFEVSKTYLIGDMLPRKELIVKLRKSSGSKLFHVFKKINEIESIILKYGADALVIQEFIASEDEYTATVFSDGIVINTIIFKRKLTGGLTYEVELIRDDEMVAELVRLSEITRLRGVLNVQYKKIMDKNIIFEVNPRVSGSTMFKYMLGFDEVKWWIDSIEGLEVYKYVQKYKKAIGVIEVNRHFVCLD